MGKTKASEKVRYFQNPNGPVIGVTAREPICVDGLYFRDINGDGVLSCAGDWRKSPKERAEALAKELSVDEKIGLIFLSSWKMGIEQEKKELVDETGLLDEEYVEKGSSIFAVTSKEGTTKTMKDFHVREFILRANPKPDELADWINELNRLAEEAEHFVPALVVSNSRNENGEVVFGMNDASGVFATWPGTMGIAAAIKGSGDLSIIDDFADCIKREWDAVGMKKGYMYMADCMTDPRWQRTYGTFGEDPELIQEIFRRLIPGVQGSDSGVTTDGVALTVKHFPGGGARENGFDPHYRQGQWNVYQTPDSLRKYHIKGFLPAIEKKAASIMPYYAKPARAKSAEQYDQNGNPIEWIPVGFAFNKAFIQDILRDQMGFEGYVNSDSGIVQRMAWGVEELEICERVALAINTGVDIISGSYDLECAREAYDRGQNGYYTTQGHPVPEGYQLEQIILTEEALNRAVARTLEERFTLGLFENPYRDPAKAVEVVATKKDWDAAADVHRKSVVLLKKDSALPVKEGTKVYVECFNKTPEAAEAATSELKKMVEAENVELVDDYTKADTAILFVTPSSGEYFNATKGYLELDICDGKEVCDVDDEGRPAETTHLETTLSEAGKIARIADAVHANGGKVISSINFTLAWEVGNVEKYSDVLLAGFDTYPSAILDVIFGRFAPVGKLPITLPKDDSVLKVNADGVCISPNDVPGYDKDQYMPEEMKDENGKAYAYRDAAGNYYEMGFGLNA
ncbi:MAG: glycoside hydrolase family 3 N-terminal domain-containing protein [Fusicatenibacter sp.]|nr:glycoside hydrolase family 3 N-terminal domain-containing protein [Lachnospiraceae bacterium]MDY2936736.1 glycoside hydrolase family 3 N-terminal domain-containing protein [Fusicatenibacter sp.]